MRFGTTTFSFTNEWLAGGLTLDGVLARIAELGLGPAIEVIGFQSWRGFPYLTRDDVLEFRRSCDRLELEPVALGAYVDTARRPEHPMSRTEAVDFLRPQVEVARALGFSILRLHAGIPVEVLEHVVPLAESAGLTLATEVQGHQTPEDPSVAGVLELRERLDTPRIALTLDFSVAMRDIPTTFVDRVVALGMDAADLDELVTRWHGGATVRELFEGLDAIQAPAAALVEARSGFVRFGRQRPKGWLPYVPYVAYAHAKFWELDEEGDDPSSRTGEMLAVLAEADYDGVVSSEWGGSAWREVDEVDAFELVRRQRAFCERLLSVSRSHSGPGHEGRGHRETFAAT